MAAPKKKPVKKKPVKKKQAKKKAKPRKKPAKVIQPAPVEVKPTGRPELYAPELADKLCEEIATSTKSLRTICLADGMPSVRTVLRWLREDKEGFCAQYARAKEEQADFMAEEIIEIADDGTNDYMTITKGDVEYNVENKEVTNRSRLRVEARKWSASKLKPKKYGDKLNVGHLGKDGEPVDPPKQVMIINGKEIEF